MNEELTIEQRLEELGHELHGSSDFTERVMAEVRNQNKTERIPVASEAKSSPRRWRAPLAIAASVMLVVSVWWLSRPVDLYARIVAALSEARTVHSSGWTRVIVRKWPLESAPANDVSEQWPEGKVPIEMWHWTDPDGTSRSYEKAGPVTLVRNGGDMQEYQEDADLTYFYEGGYNKDRVAEFSGRAQFLSLLERPSLAKEDLGARQEAGRQLQGLRLTQADRVEEFWFDDETALPVRFVRQDKSSGQTMLELTFRINEPVPTVVATFAPPATKHVRYGGGSKTNDAWLAHVVTLGERLQAQSPAGQIALWPRDGQIFANQWPLLAANGKYWVRPLDVDQYKQMPLTDFIRRGVATNDDDRRMGTWRIPKEFHDLEFPRADLVHTADMPWQDWVQFALGQLGLEFVDQTEDRVLWVARHGSRPLKRWQDVNPPVPYIVEGGKVQKGYVKPGVGHILHPVTLQQLFESFNNLIDQNDFAADKPWIIDTTNRPAPPPYDAAKHGTPVEYREKVVSQYYVATDAPWFVGKESIQMARDWYAKEFDISFVEITRPVTVHVIRRKR